jgi:phosphatidylglycerophosphate synthase
MNSKAFAFLKRIREEYRSSLKPSETEELINQVLNRPAAFISAKFFGRLGAGPNLVTMVSMLFGVSSGIFFSRGTQPSVLIGALLLEGMVILDCADGQLARMQRKSSQFGKTIDGLCDIATHFSVFYGTAFALHAGTGSMLPFVLAFLSQLSFYLHIILFDHFKNVFISVANPQYSDKLETLYRLKDDITRGKRSREKNGLKRFTTLLYYLFYQLENWIVSIGYPPGAGNFYEIFPDSEAIDEKTRDEYYREMKGSVKAWTGIGDTIHLTIFIVCGITGCISCIFPVILIGTNLWMVFALLLQRTKFKRLGFSVVCRESEKGETEVF